MILWYYSFIVLPTVISMRTTFMASIVAKKRGKNVYYYYVESVRKNGKPTIANQKYLGTASAVKAKLEASVASMQVNVNGKP